MLARVHSVDEAAGKIDAVTRGGGRRRRARHGRPCEAEQQFGQKRPTAQHQDCVTRGRRPAVSLRSATNVYSPETFTAADASSLAQLMGSGSLGGLERLDLSGKKLGAEALRPVVDALGDGALPWLRHLNIGGNKLGDGIEQLAAALKAQMPRINCVLGSLESLHTATNELTNDGVIALTSALALGALPWLKVLGLGGNKIGDRAVESLVESGSAGTFKTLEGLGLDNVGITAEGVTTMAAGLRDGAFPSLRRLSLSRLHEQHADIKAAAEERRVHLGFY